MQTFVSDLIDIRTLQVGGFVLKNEPFDAKDVLGNICAVFKPQCDAK